MWCSAIGCIMTLTLSLLMTPIPAAAQAVGKVPRLGVLAPGSPPGEPGRGLDRLRQGLHDLGYVEGQTIALEVRWDEQHPEGGLDVAIADLVQRPVDILVTGTTAAALAAQQATSTIPIVIASSADPLGAGLVASLGRPGGNITGLSGMDAELPGKRLGLTTTKRGASKPHRPPWTTADHKWLRAYVAGQISAAELCAKLPGRTWDAIESQQRVLGLVQQHKPIYYRIDASIRDIVSEESSSRATSLWLLLSPWGVRGMLSDGSPLKR